MLRCLRCLERDDGRVLHDGPSRSNEESEVSESESRDVGVGVHHMPRLACKVVGRLERLARLRQTYVNVLIFSKELAPQ